MKFLIVNKDAIEARQKQLRINLNLCIIETDQNQMHETIGELKALEWILNSNNEVKPKSKNK